MAAVRYAGQPLCVGDWVNPASMMLIGFAGRPAQVTEVRGKSVLIARAVMRGGVIALDQPTSKLIRLIAFVSSSFEDAQAVTNANNAFMDAEYEHERQYKAERAARQAAAIAKATGA